MQKEMGSVPATGALSAREINLLLGPLRCPRVRRGGAPNDPAKQKAFVTTQKAFGTKHLAVGTTQRAFGMIHCSFVTTQKAFEAKHRAFMTTQRASETKQKAS
jgi:hypothetical protein